ncbi:MAG: hypothetical protein WCI41_01605 [bacterium]
MEERLENFILTPRYLTDMLRNGKISVVEYLVLSWIRNNADPYGVTTTSLDDLANDLNKKRNYINRIVLSLKSKKLIDYKDRTGRRGSFKIHLDFWILPNKTLKNRGEFYGRGEIRDLGNVSSEIESKPNQSNDMDIQSLNSKRNELIKGYSPFSSDSEVRGSNNDTHKENKIVSSSFKERTYLSEFKPKNSDEECCLNIATKLGERNINFMLSALKKYGREYIEKAWRAFQEAEQNTTIKKRGAYFNALLKKAYEEEN